MRITEERYRHWKALRERPGVVVMMSKRVHDVVDMAAELERAHPHAWFAAILTALAYANQLDERWYEVNGVQSDT